MKRVVLIIPFKSLCVKLKSLSPCLLCINLYSTFLRFLDFRNKICYLVKFMYNHSLSVV